MRPGLLFAMVMLLSARLGAQEPDFETFLVVIDAALAQTGSAAHAGERTELVRYAEDGWEILISAAWDGAEWRLLALRLHHPERIDSPDQRWAERYRALLAALAPEQIRDIEPPALFEVPPPSFLPAFPEELRSRQFDIGQFWYQASWFNDGGFNEDASWALRSFELVARPPPQPQ